MPRRAWPVPVWLLLAAAAAQAADERIPLQVNPFVRPESGAAANAARAGADTGAMELRALMLAGKLSLANIGGHIVGIGEEINGYRLVAVNGDGVVLERDGAQKVLEVRKQDGVGHDTQVNASW